jgi:hypothetical protein
MVIECFRIAAAAPCDGAPNYSAIGIAHDRLPQPIASICPKIEHIQSRAHKSPMNFPLEENANVELGAQIERIWQMSLRRLWRS